MLQQILIPAAAFAITATGVSAFSADMLDKIDVDLSDSQVAALKVAHELRADGAERSEVQSYLEENDLDRDTMKEIKDAAKELRSEHRTEVKSAIENNDYTSFVEAIVDSPLADQITSEADFEKFVEAHELREAGDRAAAKEIMSELGIERPAGHGHKGGERGFGGPDREGRQSAEVE